MSRSAQTQQSRGTMAKVRTKSCSSSPNPCYCIPSEQYLRYGASDTHIKRYRALPPPEEKDEDTDEQPPEESSQEEEVLYSHYKPYHYPGCLCRECCAWSQMYNSERGCCGSNIPSSRVYNIYYATVIRNNQMMYEEHPKEGNICLIIKSTFKNS